MNLHLKVKLCTLAAEAQVIRANQNRMLRRAGKPPVSTLVLHQDVMRGELSDKTKEELRAFRLEKKLYKAKVAKIKLAKGWSSLQDHKRTIIRREARASNLAYAFLRGVPYFAVEQRTHDQYPENNIPLGYNICALWKQVEIIVKRFTTEKDPRILAQRFEQWKQDGRKDQDNYKNGQQTPQTAGDQTRLSA